MRKSVLLLIGVLIVFIFLGILMMQSLVVVQRIASVSDVVGDVYVQARGESDFRALGATEHVLAGSTVKTTADSAVTLNWVDGSRIRLGPETSINVRKCSLNTSTKETTSLFDLDAGRVWVRVLTMLRGKSKFEIRTPTATAGVRGTVFYVEVADAGETTVAVYEGAVSVEAEEVATTVRPQQQAIAAEGSAPTVMPAVGDLAWEQHQGIIGPRLDLDIGPEVTVAADQSTLTVSGVAEPGAKVTINGSPVELDPMNRFAAEVPIGAAPDGMLVVSATDVRGHATVRAIAVTRGA
ncbi:MAG: FecR family protein [Armatimonadota bacterium]|nr:FecR family protein [Armatimonadota bacterium]